MLSSKNFHLPNVQNDAEVQALAAQLNQIPGVRRTIGDAKTKIFVVEWSDPATWDHISDALVRMGYVPKSK